MGTVLPFSLSGRLPLLLKEKHVPHCFECLFHFYLFMPQFTTVARGEFRAGEFSDVILH